MGLCAGTYSSADTSTNSSTDSGTDTITDSSAHLVEEVWFRP
jgi:hypothetical protein